MNIKLINKTPWFERVFVCLGLKKESARKIGTTFGHLALSQLLHYGFVLLRALVLLDCQILELVPLVHVIVSIQKLFEVL